MATKKRTRASGKTKALTVKSLTANCAASVKGGLSTIYVKYLRWKC